MKKLGNYCKKTCNFFIEKTIENSKKTNQLLSKTTIIMAKNISKSFFVFFLWIA